MARPSTDVSELLPDLLGWLTGVLFCGALLLVWRHKARLLPVQRHRAVPWTGMEILLALFLGLLVWPVVCREVLIRTHFLTWVYGANLAPPPGKGEKAALDLWDKRENFWAVAFAFPCQLMTILVVLRSGSGTRPYQLGLTCRRAAADVAAGCAGWLILTPLVLIVNLAATVCYQHLTRSAPQGHPLTQVIGPGALPVDWALAVFTAVVAAPILEELVFRGMLQFWLVRHAWARNVALAGAFAMAALSWSTQGFGPAVFVLAMVPGYLFIGPLTRRWLADPGSGPAIYSTALLFAAFHSFVWPTPIALFVLGLGLGYLAYRTQSLIGPMVWHGVFNATMCVALALS